jgi:nitrate reductase (NAD(P)H)
VLEQQGKYEEAEQMQRETLSLREKVLGKNTQPEHGVWNTMGMMNNGWHKVKPTIEQGGCLVYHHPVDLVNNEGWMKLSVENQLAAATQSSDTPDKQFTRQEIEKHCKQSDAWLVINEKVYDVTSVIDWHPGGKASLLAYAGKLTQEVTSSFESIHDEYAHKKLAECVIGRVTDKAANFIKQQAKAAAEEAANTGDQSKNILLQKKTWTPVKLLDRKQLSEDTFAYTFSVPDHRKIGLGTCQHIQFGIHMRTRCSSGHTLRRSQFSHLTIRVALS